MNSQNKLLKTAKQTARIAGIDWCSIENRAKQIIVYGSRATLVHRRTSDLDLLCVGHGHRYKSKNIHIIWVKESRLRNKRWLGSELATHIAAYGKWIKGKNTWAISSRPNAYAIRLIEKRIQERTDTLLEQWLFLLPVFRKKQLVRLRRDLQRYVMMLAGHPPVPTGTLDRQWLHSSQAEAWQSLLAKAPAVRLNITALLKQAKIKPLPKAV